MPIAYNGTKSDSGFSDAEGTIALTISPGAGDLMIRLHSAELASGTLDAPGGTWTSIATLNGTPTTFTPAEAYYKVADGTETSESCVATSTGHTAWVGVFDGWSGTATLEDSDDDEGNINANGTSFAYGSFTNTTAAALAIAMLIGDRFSGLDTTMGDPSGYTSHGSAGEAIRCGLWMWSKVLSATGTETPTNSTTDSGDQWYGVGAVFGDVGAGGGFEAAWARGATQTIINGSVT